MGKVFKPTIAEEGVFFGSDVAVLTETNIAPVCVLTQLLTHAIHYPTFIDICIRERSKHIILVYSNPLSLVHPHVQLAITTSDNWGHIGRESEVYITEVFSKEPELQMNFLKYIFLVPHIKSMMYIPLNCAIIAQVYYESQSSRHLTIPRTRTQLYKALTHSLLVRHMKMKNSDFEYESMLPEGLDKKNKEMFKSLVSLHLIAITHGGQGR